MDGQVIVGNCADILKDLDDGIVDMVLTSPPYDNLRKYNSYVFDFNRIASELYRVVADGGVVVWVVGDATHNGSETGTSFKQALGFMDIGFNLHDTMIFQKINPIPLTHNRYEQAFEYMFILSKGKPKTFNPITEPCKTSGAYTHRRNTGRVEEAATRNRDEVTVTNETKYKDNVWSYVLGSRKGETGNHPAAFPEELARDHIISWSNPADLVLDPMCGSGTTAKVCKQLGRRYIAIDISDKYCRITRKRLERTQPPLFIYR